MSAVPCGRCGFPVEDERRDYVLPRCFACLPPPEPLRAIPTRDQLEAEVARLRAALSEIAALQTEEPVNPLTEDIGPRAVWADMDDCFEGAMSYGMRFARHEAAEMARKGLGS